LARAIVDRLDFVVFAGVRVRNPPRQRLARQYRKRQQKQQTVLFHSVVLEPA
jgi:hypothetical protein